MKKKFNQAMINNEIADKKRKISNREIISCFIDKATKEDIDKVYEIIKNYIIIKE